MKKLLLLLACMGLATPLLAEEQPAAQAPNAAEAAEAAPEAPAEPVLSGGTVARATFTHDVADREPVDSVNTLTSDASKVYYFTELRDMAGQTVTHRWEYNGKVMAEVPFTVNGSRWRVYSSKNLDTGWLGEWKVSVIDQAGGTVAVNTFTYEKAPEAPAAADNAGTANTPAAEGAATPAQ
jgi:hypothetical protein